MIKILIDTHGNIEDIIIKGISLNVGGYLEGVDYKTNFVEAIFYDPSLRSEIDTVTLTLEGPIKLISRIKNKRNKPYRPLVPC